MLRGSGLACRLLPHLSHLFLDTRPRSDPVGSDEQVPRLELELLRLLLQRVQLDRLGLELSLALEELFLALAASELRDLRNATEERADPIGDVQHFVSTIDGPFYPIVDGCRRGDKRKGVQSLIRLIL